MKLDEQIRRYSCLIICVGLIIISPMGTSCAVAADAAATGIAQFNAKQYRPALASFRKAIAAKPRDSTLYYYYALCQHKLNDIEGAKATYMEIIKFFPGTDAAMQAGGTLGVLQRTHGMTPTTTTNSEPETIGAPTTTTRTTTTTTTRTIRTNPRTSPTSIPGASSSSSSSTTTTVQASHGLSGAGAGTVSGPDECNIRFERVNNSLILDVMVNNRPTKMIFDTGAEGCVFGKNHLQEMSIPAPTGHPTGKAGGVGDGGVQDTWDMPVSLTVGPINRKNFVVCVEQEMGGQPLLGQTFFQDFTYTIDNGANNIHLRRKNKPQGSIYSQKNDPNAVPFTRMGNEIIVTAQINGRQCQVIFDTGASVCAFTRDQIGALGISIPEDAQHGMTQGIAGTSSTSVFPISSLKLGPIEKRDFEIHVVENAHMPAPLLGQTFYGDWQFTIDYENKIIHFLRR